MPLNHTISLNIYNVKAFIHFVVKREAAVHFLVYYVPNDSDFFQQLTVVYPQCLSTAMLTRQHIKDYASPI